MLASARNTLHQAKSWVTSNGSMRPKADETSAGRGYYSAVSEERLDHKGVIRMLVRWAPWGSV